jgi:hypothetical protein
MLSLSNPTLRQLDAVLRNLEILSEATKNPQEVRNLNPHIDWKRIAGFEDHFGPYLLWSRPGDHLGHHSKRAASAEEWNREGAFLNLSFLACRLRDLDHERRSHASEQQASR